MARIIRDSAFLLGAGLFLGLPLAAHASLLDRGGGLIYDTDLDCCQTILRGTLP